MGGMTLDLASSTRTEGRGIEDMEREPDVKEEQGGMDKEWDQNKILNYKLYKM